MTNQPNPTDQTVQRKIDQYRQHGLTENIRDLLLHHLDLPEATIETLAQHTQFMLGHTWERVDGKTTDLTESMSGIFEENSDLRDDRFLLEKSGLIERKQLHRGRTYWNLTGPYWDIVEDNWRFDIGEGPEHRRAVALLKTYFYALQGCEIDAYPTLATGGAADLHVHVTPPRDCDPTPSRAIAAGLRDELIEKIIEKNKRKAAQQRRKEMWPPGERDIVCEVMMGHENTQSVLDRFDQLKDVRANGLWIFEDRKTMNKWLRRLQAPDIEGEDRRIETPYSWSPTTPIDTAQERIEQLDESAMRSVTTISRVEDWVSEFEGRRRLLRRAVPLHERN